MASYDALINLRVKGLNDLNKIDSAINGITKGAKETTKTVKGANKVLMSQGLALRNLAKRQNTLVEKFHRVTGKSKGGTMASFLLPDSRMLNASKRKIQELVTDQQKHINKVAQARQNAQKRALDGEKRIKIENQAVARSKAAADRAEIKRLEAIIKLRRLAAQAGRVGTKLGDVLAPPELKTRGKGGKMLALPSAEMRAGAPGAFQNAPGFRGTRQAPTARGRGSGALQSALISGAFPLLFGQGPLGGAAGFAGGFAGSKMGGQMGGFAGGLVATAALQTIQNTISAISQLGQALNPFTADVGKLTQALGLAGTAEGARLKAIEALSGKQAALAEATRLLNQKIGVAGTEALKTFGENMRGVGNEFSVLMTKLGVAVATVVNDSGFIQFTNNFLDFANSLDQEKLNKITKFFAELAKNLAGFGPLDKVTGIIGGITGALGIKGNEKDQTITMDVVGDRTGMLADQFLGKEKDKRIDELAILEKTINGGKELGNIEKMRVDLKNKLKALNIDINKLDKDNLNEALKGLNAQDKLIDGYKRQLALAKQIKSVLAEGMSSAIEGLITGTKSLSESFSQMLRQFGSLLLRTGISNMMGGLNLGGFFGKGIGSAEGNYLANGIRPFASGGMVTRPTMGLVGEAGEDEYVIPASKMASSMQRYSAGARGQAVIPGTGQSSAGGASGSSTTVNYSGPILNFNSEEFVPKSAIGQIINSAASKGASAGEARTLSTLRNSRSTRSRIGM